MPSPPTTPKVAVLVPCYNEAATIEDVIAGFRAALPQATIHVYDNNSTDDTLALATSAGAVVGNVSHQGKGHVVRRQFADIDADIYILVDGDATYSAACAPKLVNSVIQGHDMVVGVRGAVDSGAYRFGHAFGNRLLTGFLSWIFGQRFQDILSGYRAFSRRYIKSFPLLSNGFEIETELTVHALELNMPVAEIPTPYRERPDGSESKLNTWKDGFRILMTILKLFSTERPAMFYGTGSLLLMIGALALGFPLITTYLETGLVPRYPTAIIVTSMFILSGLMLLAGIIINSIATGRREAKIMAYLNQTPPSAFDTKSG